MFFATDNEAIHGNMDVTLAMFPPKKKTREKKSRVILDKFLSLFGLEQPSVCLDGKGSFSIRLFGFVLGCKKKEIRSLWLIFSSCFDRGKALMQCLK